MESDPEKLTDFPLTPFVSLKFPEFRSYIGIRLAITFAYQIQGLIIGWHMYLLTHNTFTLGLIGLAEALPAISTALFAGHLADHSDKKKMMLIVISGMFISSSTLLYFTQPHISMSVSLSWQVGIMFAMIVCNGICRGFYSPAAFSLLGSLVPRKYYANSSTWNSSAFQVSTVLGPAIGGLVLGFFGITAAFMLVICSQLIAMLFLSTIANRPPNPLPNSEELSIFNSLGEGIKFVFSNKMMLGALSLDLFSVFFGGAIALLPVYATDILHVGATGLGCLRSAPAAGSLITMGLMLYRTPIGKAWRNLLLGVTGFGLATILFALSTNFFLSLFALFLTGAFDSISVIIRSTILQVLTPDNMRGRVSAVNTMFISSSNEIGGFESGTAARLVGTVPSVVFGGAMVLLISGLTFLNSKELLKNNLVKATLA